MGATAVGDIAEDAAFGPIAAAALAEVARLREVVVVVVAEFGVERVAARALDDLVIVRPHPPISDADKPPSAADFFSDASFSNVNPIIGFSIPRFSFLLFEYPLKNPIFSFFLQFLILSRFSAHNLTVLASK